MVDLQETNGHLIEELDALRRQIAALQESESKFRGLFQDSAVGTVFITPDAKFLQVNRAFCEFVGYSEQELLGMTVPDITYPEDIKPSSQVISRAFTSGIRIQRFEKRYLHKSGQICWGEVSSTLICDAEGKPSFLIAQVLDISERKQAEAALAEAKRDLERQVEDRTADLLKANKELEIHRLFAQNATQGFGIVDLAGYRKYSNPALCRIMGEESNDELHEDLVGWQITKYGRTVGSLENDFTPNLLRDGRWDREGMLRSSQGKSVFVWLSSFIIRDDGGQPAYIATILTDITERKLAETALRQSRDELQAIYEGMLDGLAITDLETYRFVRVNASLCRMLGYSEAELLSMSPDDIHPADEIRVVREILLGRAEGRFQEIASVKVLRKDGTIFHADIMGNPLEYRGRSCIAGFFRNVTQRKRVEEALRKEHLTLKHLLQSSDHERRTIAYEIHDGLAQYLAASIMQFEAFKHLLEYKPQEARPVFEEAMKYLHQSHYEARRLIAGVRPPVLDEAGVVMAVNHLISEQNRGKEPQIEFVSKVEFDRLVPILENAIYRICQEGLSNVCKHSQSSRARIKLLQHKNRLQIEIRDWGKGFAPRQIKDGCYGLAGIRERARLLGGKFCIQSASGKGSRIRVDLPLMEKED
jgi:PAS domain S-box-containing protein